MQYNVLDINHCRQVLQNLTGFGTPLGCKIRHISCSRLYFNSKRKKALQIKKKPQQLLYTIIMSQRKVLLIWKCLVACCSCNTNDKTALLRCSVHLVILSCDVPLNLAIKVC